QANIGDACDDGNAHTVNDVITANCECVGTVVYDCPGLQANIGDACDDGNPNTDNDVVTAACVCEGEIHIGVGSVEGGSGISLALYPNPSRTGLVTLHMEGLGTGQGTVEITVLDAAGRKVYQQQATAVHGVLHHGLELAGHISQGLYVVEVIAGHQRFMERLVLQ
ncbi:MAG: T9SS type A sorting domain-containing protein, partial [Bacteroidetes bacterium]|nr:T9SS type A sorting domain-containing protein [Bacteroidota bacterium]